ncbi:MAG: TetR/AcrR family transcriptional regulator [Coriobacteriaceae bacterium]|nr:TetR/AcrR family transcriptional regulator [Coriobacteriaceae bacterium]
MKKNSKKPAERRKELVQAAAQLFAEKGYEATSVRDILDAVGGAPGMFYYYFASKQDVYVAVMEDFISERMVRKCAVMEDHDRPFDERIAALRSLVVDDVDEYVRSYDPKPGEPVPDASYKLWDMIQMLDRMAGPYAKLILEGVRGGEIKNRLGVNKNNAQACALFVLYGLWGVMYDGRFAPECDRHTPEEAFEIVQELFH